VVPRQLPAAPLVVRRRCLIVVPRPMPVAPRRYLIVLPRPLPAAPLVVHRKYLIVAPRPLLAAQLVVCRSYLLDRGAQAVARGAATQSQQEKNNSADAQRN
jgi:hypothetical protein